jgi:hypothetical protein
MQSVVASGTQGFSLGPLRSAPRSGYRSAEGGSEVRRTKRLNIAVVFRSDPKSPKKSSKLVCQAPLTQKPSPQKTITNSKSITCKTKINPPKLAF